jgi:hypothetical protein
MSTADLVSILLLGVGMTIAAVLVREAMRHLPSRVLALVFCLGLLVAGVAAIWFVDVNIPLRASHWRPSGVPASGWIALLACSVRFGALTGLILLARRLSRS